MMFWIIFLSSSFSKHWHDNYLISLDSKIFYLFCDIGYSRKWCFESLPCNLQKYFTFSTQHAVTCCLWEWWHFYSCSSLWGKSPLRNASNPAATLVSIIVLTPLCPATSKQRVCAPRVRTGQSVSAAQVAEDGNMELFIKLFTNFSDSPKPKKRNRHLCPPPTPCNCER